MGVVRRPLRLGVWLVLGVLVLTLAAVVYFSDRNLRLHGNGRSLEAPVDAAIVLGGGVDPDGVLGFSTRRRVATGVSLLAAGKARHLILSGGPILHQRVTAAAELMREHAVALGAPPDTLVLEARSRSTFENLRFSLRIAEERGFERLAVLTDAHHLERARWLAGYFGAGEIGLVAARGLEHESWHDRAYHVAREALAWWYNLAKIAAWETLAAAGLDPRERRAWVK